MEELFGRGPIPPPSREPEWPWPPAFDPCRFWTAEVGGRLWRYPVELSSSQFTPHDGFSSGGVARESEADDAERTLVLACCDPAAGLLAAEYARECGFRLLVLSRGGGAALDLLKRGLVHVAGVHRSTPQDPARNAETVRAELGGGYCLLRAARWEEGIVLPPQDRTRSTAVSLRQPHRWALREPGSAARECLDELRGSRRLPGRVVDGHVAVAQAVRHGWASAGVCVKHVATEAGLNFLPVRVEMLDFCFADSLRGDPRGQAFIRLLRSRAYRRLVSELPGCDARETGDLVATSACPD